MHHPKWTRAGAASKAANLRDRWKTGLGASVSLSFKIAVLVIGLKSIHQYGRRLEEITSGMREEGLVGDTTKMEARSEHLELRASSATCLGLISPPSVLVPHKHGAVLCGFRPYQALLVSFRRWEFVLLEKTCQKSRDSFKLRDQVGWPPIMGDSSPCLWRCFSGIPGAVRAAWLHPSTLTVHLIFSNMCL